MKNRYTETELTEIFFEALDQFNECLDSDIAKENVILRFFMPQNGVEVYKSLCKAHFTSHLSEAYHTEGYFETFAAQAFVSDTKYGVLIRADIDFTLAEVYQVFLHEISHLFCTKNEIPQGFFYDKYCMGTGEDDGIINAGYAIWREAIADIMADSALTDYTTTTLDLVSSEVNQLYREISISNSDSKKCMSLIIAYLMISKEVAVTANWKIASREIVNHISIDDPPLLSILQRIFEKLHTPPFWCITPEFIREIGFEYIEFLTFRQFGAILRQE